MVTRAKKHRYNRTSNAIFSDGKMWFGKDQGHSFDYKAAADHFDIDPDSIFWIVAAADQQLIPGMCHDYCSMKHMPGHETLEADKHQAAIHLRARLKPVRKRFFRFAQHSQPQAVTDDDDPLQECACSPPCDTAWTDTGPHGSHPWSTSTLGGRRGYCRVLILHGCLLGRGGLHYNLRHQRARAYPMPMGASTTLRP